MKLENRPLTVQQATSNREVRAWAEYGEPLPAWWSSEPGDREAVLAELISRRAGPSVWLRVATPFALSLDASMD